MGGISVPGIDNYNMFDSSNLSVPIPFQLHWLRYHRYNHGLTDSPFADNLFILFTHNPCSQIIHMIFHKIAQLAANE